MYWHCITCSLALFKLPPWLIDIADDFSPNVIIPQLEYQDATKRWAHLDLRKHFLSEPRGYFVSKHPRIERSVWWNECIISMQGYGSLVTCWRLASPGYSGYWHRSTAYAKLRAMHCTTWRYQCYCCFYATTPIPPEPKPICPAFYKAACNVHLVVI